MNFEVYAHTSESLAAALVATTSSGSAVIIVTSNVVFESRRSLPSGIEAIMSLYSFMDCVCIRLIGVVLWGLHGPILRSLA